MRWLTAIVVIVLDRLFKILAYQQILSHQGKGFLVNQNISFSIPLSNAWALAIGIIITLCLVGLAVRHKNNQWPVYGLALTIIGSASNLWDRFHYNGVIDYIDFGWWPIFNLADLLILIGLAIFFLSLFHKQQIVKNT
ncbi:MAG: signal peptidase II [bacterium]